MSTSVVWPRLEVGQAPKEGKALTGPPDTDPPDLEQFAGGLVIDLDQPAALTRLEAHRARLVAAKPIALPFLPPAIDVPREQFEGGGRLDVPAGSIPRSSPSWRSIALLGIGLEGVRAGRSRIAGSRRASAAGRRTAPAAADRCAAARHCQDGFSSISLPARRMRRWRLIAGALIFAAAANSPARRGRSLSRSITPRRVWIGQRRPGCCSSALQTPWSLIFDLELCGGFHFGSGNIAQMLAKAPDHALPDHGPDRCGRHKTDRTAPARFRRRSHGHGRNGRRYSQH